MNESLIPCFVGIVCIVTIEKERINASNDVDRGDCEYYCTSIEGRTLITTSMPLKGRHEN